MDVKKFRLDWRNSPQKQLDALQQMVQYLANMANQLTDISVKLDVLPIIKELEEKQALLLQQVADNTDCACNALQDVNNKLDEIIDIIKNTPPASVYDFVLTTVSHEIQGINLINGYIDLSGSSLKDSVLFDSVLIVDCPEWLNPTVSVLPDDVIRVSFISGVNVPAGTFVLQFVQAESNIIQQVELFYIDYVEIAGVKWAKGNLIVDPSDPTGMTSLIAPREDMSTEFYQWNAKRAWPRSGSVSGWPSSGSVSNAWSSVNDPSPDGWRVPNSVEFTSLMSSGYRYCAVGSAGNAVPGFFFGPNASIATMSNPSGCIFLPIVGYRNSSGTLVAFDSVGSLWLSAVSSSNPSAFYYLYLADGATPVLRLNPFSFGYNIRPVKAGKIMVYNLSYNANSGSLSGGVTAGSYTQGTTITLPTSATRTGYTFVGFTSSAWTGNKALGATFVMPANDVQVLAVWQQSISTIVADVTSVDIDAQGVPVVIHLTSMSAWSILSRPDWLNVSPVSGTSGSSQEITLTAPPNPPAPRSGILRFVNADEDSLSIDVSQTDIAV